MSRHRTSWIDVVAGTLGRLPGSWAAGVTDQHAFFRRVDFKRICDEIEAELKHAGIQPSDEEWQATKFIMKSIYKKTKSAYKNGYDFFQYALTPHLEDPALKERMVSPSIQRGVELWCSLLGWRSASIVNWTSVEAAIAKATTSRYPYAANEFAVRLEGLGKMPVVGPEREFPRLQPTIVSRSGFSR